MREIILQRIEQICDSNSNAESAFHAYLKRDDLPSMSDDELVVAFEKVVIAANRWA